MKKVLLILVCTMCTGCLGNQVRSVVSQTVPLPGGAESGMVVHEYHNFLGHNMSSGVHYIRKPNGEICLFPNSFADAGLAKAAFIAASHRVIGDAVRDADRTTVRAGNSSLDADLDSTAQSDAQSFLDNSP